MDTELHEMVSTFFEKQKVECYRMAIEKLVYRYNKCLDLLDDYVEK